MDKMNNQDRPKVILLPIIVTQKNGKAAMEIRKLFTEREIINTLTKAAFRQQPIIVYPIFTDRLKSVHSLIDKGILYHRGGQYYFTNI